MPRALGGFGIASSLQMLANISADTIEQAASNCDYLANVNDEYRTIWESILETPPKVKDPT